MVGWAYLLIIMKRGIFVVRTFRLKDLVLNLLPPILVGILGAVLTRNSGQVYANLNRPPLSPPAIVFPIVWSILYILIGIAAFLAEHKDCKYYKASRAVYYIGLVLNLLWPILFFTLGLYTLALVELILLWVVVAINAILFYFCNEKAGYLMIPYIIWLSFAAYLNIGVVFLN